MHAVVSRPPFPRMHLLIIMVGLKLGIYIMWLISLATFHLAVHHMIPSQFMPTSFPYMLATYTGLYPLPRLVLHTKLFNIIIIISQLASASVIYILYRSSATCNSFTIN